MKLNNKKCSTNKKKSQTLLASVMHVDLQADHVYSVLTRKKYIFENSEQMNIDIKKITENKRLETLNSFCLSSRRMAYCDVAESYVATAKHFFGHTNHKKVVDEQ